VFPLASTIRTARSGSRVICFQVMSLGSTKPPGTGGAPGASTHAANSVRPFTVTNNEALSRPQADPAQPHLGSKRQTFINQIKKTNPPKLEVRKGKVLFSAKSLVKHGVARRRKSSSRLATSLHFGWRRLSARQVGES
jgi:hypothetical protein